MNTKVLLTSLAVLLQAGAITYGALCPSGFLDSAVQGPSPTGNLSVLDPSVSFSLSQVNASVQPSYGAKDELSLRLSRDGVLLLAPCCVGTGLRAAIQSARFDTVIPDYASSAGAVSSVADPRSLTVCYVADNSKLSSFESQNLNGGGTILFADMAGGATSSGLAKANRGLGVTPVPEPINVGLGIFGGIFVLALVTRSPWVRRRFGWRQDGFTHCA